VPRWTGGTVSCSSVGGQGEKVREGQAKDEKKQSYRGGYNVLSVLLPLFLHSHRFLSSRFLVVGTFVRRQVSLLIVMEVCVASVTSLVWAPTRSKAARLTNPPAKAGGLRLSHPLSLLARHGGGDDR